MIASGALRKSAVDVGRVLAALLLVIAGQWTASAQGGSPAPEVDLTAAAADDGDGRVTMAAVRVERLQLDGRLDESFYETVPPVGNFIQQDPQEGAPATHRTDLWVFYDDDNMYVAMRLWTPPDLIISNELRRDSGNVWSSGDSVSVIVDTFLDRRTAYFFQTNPGGAIRDGFLPDENRNTNIDFDLVWDVRTARFDGGWTFEMAIPFKSIRYPSGRQQTWGFNVLRMERGINEASSWSALPASYGGMGIFKVSSAGTLVGVEAPAKGGLFDVKPYTLAIVLEDRTLAGDTTDIRGEFGFDAKFKATKSINVDFSYNTDFAQVEVDNQQLNLTRFGLFYPEKREFFLEGQSYFNFASSLSGQQGSEVPIFFFSRRIGLSEGRTVPIDAAGRVMGRAGAYTVGAMSVRTGESADASQPATTFSVARVRRDILRRSSLGVLVTDRRPADGGDDNQVFGLDLGLRFYENVDISGYYALSRTPSLTGNESSYAGHFRWAADLYGVEFGRVTVGEAFNPEIGFLTRRGFDRHFGTLRYSRRPENLWGIRKVDWEASLNDVASTGGERQTQVAQGTFRVQTNSGDQFSAVYSRNDERPEAPFEVAGAPIEPGPYRFDDVRLTYQFGPRWPFVGSVAVAKGGFYGGNKTETVVNGRVSIRGRLSIEPTLTLTWLEMPTGDFDAQVIGARTTFTFSPRAAFSALTQYSSVTRSLGTNARFRWEYRPGSDLYIVYTDARDTLGEGYPSLVNRSLSLKFTRLFQL